MLFLLQIESESADLKVKLFSKRGGTKTCAQIIVLIQDINTRYGCYADSPGLDISTVPDL